MKKKLVGILAIALLLTGCGKVPKLKNGEDAVVTFKNGDMISVNDLYSELKDDYALASLISMIDKKILESEFKNYMTTAEEKAESTMKTLRDNYETDDELLQAIQSYTNYSTIDAYKDYVYISNMQSHATEEYAKTLISDSEIENYYKNDVEGDIEVSHILITPDVKKDAKDEDIAKAEDKAEKKAQSILKELKDSKNEDVKATFKELVTKYSEDEATKKDGGSLGRINKDTLDSSYKELVDAAYSIKDGQYYNDVVKTSTGYHVILRTKSYKKASLKNSKESIIKSLSQEKIESDSDIAVKALQYYRKEHGVEIQDSKLKKQYGNYMNNQLFSNKNAE